MHGLKSPLDAEAIDRHVGVQLRYRRSAAGLSQEQVALHLGVSFQQIQKYEKGRNRISAGRLLQAAALFGVQVQCFFDGLSEISESDQSDNGDQKRILAFALTPEGAKLNLQYLNAPTSRHRKMALEVLSLPTSSEMP